MVVGGRGVLERSPSKLLQLLVSAQVDDRAKSEFVDQVNDVLLGGPPQRVAAVDAAPTDALASLGVISAQVTEVQRPDQGDAPGARFKCCFVHRVQAVPEVGNGRVSRAWKLGEER